MAAGVQVAAEVTARVLSYRGIRKVPVPVLIQLETGALLELI